MEDVFGHGEKGELIKTDRLKRCSNPECRRGLIDRDVNAAANIAYVGWHICTFGSRPSEFIKQKEIKPDSESDSDRRGGESDSD